MNKKALDMSNHEGDHPTEQDYLLVPFNSQGSYSTFLFYPTQPSRAPSAASGRPVGEHENASVFSSLSGASLNLR